MPKQRIQVESGLTAPVLRPNVVPIDTFTGPGDAGQKLSQLAQGLSEISPELRRFGVNLAQQGAEASRVEGETAARKIAEKAKSYAEATRSGAIPKSANPFFNAGLQEQFGRVSADKWQSDLMAAVRGNAALQDPAVPPQAAMGLFDEFTTQHMGDWMQKNVSAGGRTADFEKGFGFRADAYLSNARQQFASSLEGRLDVSTYDATFTEAKQHIQQHLIDLDPDVIAADLNALTKVRVAQGVRGTILNKSLVDAAVAVAKENPELGSKVLEVLKHAKGGSGALSDTKYGSKSMIDAEKEITDQLFINHQREKQLADERRETTKRTVTGQFLQDLLKNPAADPKPYASKLIQAGAGDATEALVSARRAATGFAFATNEAVKQDLFSRITGGGEFGTPVDEAMVVRQVGQKNLTTEDANFLLEKIKQFREGEEKKVFDNFGFKQELENLKLRLGEPIDGVVRADLGDKVANAQAQFRDEWLQYNLSGEAKAKTALERNKWLTEHSAQIVKWQRTPDTMAGDIAPSPAPSMVVDRAEVQKRSSTLVLSEADIYAARTGRTTEPLRHAMKQLGIPPNMTGAFVEQQSQLFEKQTGHEAKSPDTKKQKKE